MVKMKEVILKALLENTKTERRYTGGGEEPSIIVLKGSEDCDINLYLSKIADDLVKELNKLK